MGCKQLALELGSVERKPATNLDTFKGKVEIAKRGAKAAEWQPGPHRGILEGGHMSSVPRRLLYDDSYTNIVARVAYQMIALDYRKRPERYAFPAGGILELAIETRPLFPSHLYWPLQSAARWVASGVTLAQWRDELTLAQRDRAIHKRKPRALHR